MARIIGEVRPRFAFVENSPMLVNRGLERVLADLTSMGYDSRWGVISAADVGANHKRERIWILAHAHSNSNIGTQSGSNGIQNAIQGKQGAQYSSTGEFGRTNNVFRGYSLQRHEEANNVGNTQSAGFSSCVERQGQGQPWRASIGSAQWWKIEPPVDRVADGMADRVDRLKAIGNGQVPLCAATAWELLK